MSVPLAVQTFLRRGGTLADLQRDFSIRVSAAPDLGLVALNYHQFLSPMEVPLCRECRGLYLEEGTWEVAARSFFKFFNLGEPLAEELDWTTARITEKLDGSLVIFYPWRGEWRAGTRGRADASGRVGESARTFADLIRVAIADMGETWDSFTESLDPRFLYSFEMTAPENRILVAYGERRLTWLAAWDIKTLEETDIWNLPEIAAPRVTEWPVSTLDEIRFALEGLSPLEREGAVVADAAFRRVKIKSPLYVLANRAVLSVSTTKQRLEFVVAQDSDDLIAMLPEYFQVEVAAMRVRLRDLCAEMNATHLGLSHLESQKEFALEAVKTRWPAALFELRKGRTMPEVLARTTSDKLMLLLGLRDERTVQE